MLCIKHHLSTNIEDERLEFQDGDQEGDMHSLGLCGWPDGVDLSGFPFLSQERVLELQEMSTYDLQGASAFLNCRESNSPSQGHYAKEDSSSYQPWKNGSSHACSTKCAHNQATRCTTSKPVSTHFYYLIAQITASSDAPSREKQQNLVQTTS